MIKYGSAAPGGIVDHFLCAGKAARDSCSVSKSKRVIALVMYKIDTIVFGTG